MIDWNINIPTIKSEDLYRGLEAVLNRVNPAALTVLAAEAYTKVTDWGFEKIFQDDTTVAETVTVAGAALGLVLGGRYAIEKVFYGDSFLGTKINTIGAAAKESMQAAALVALPIFAYNSDGFQRTLESHQDRGAAIYRKGEGLVTRVLDAIDEPEARVPTLSENDDVHIVFPETLLAKFPTDMRLDDIVEHPAPPGKKPPFRTAFLMTYRFDSLLNQATREYGIEEGLLAGLILAESAGDPFAVSEAGAVGLMQLMPGTALQYGKDVGLTKVFMGAIYTKQVDDYVEKVRKFSDRHKSVAGGYKTAGAEENRILVELAIPTGANYLRALKDQHGTWDKALRAYLNGHVVNNGKTDAYVASIRNMQRYYRANRGAADKRYANLYEGPDAAKQNQRSSLEIDGIMIPPGFVWKQPNPAKQVRIQTPG